MATKIKETWYVVHNEVILQLFSKKKVLNFANNNLALGN
jgi:hypothetical protein